MQTLRDMDRVNFLVPLLFLNHLLLVWELDLGGHVDGESGSLANLALNADRASHLLNQ